MIRPQDRRHLQQARRSFKGRLKNDDIHAVLVFGRYAHWSLANRRDHRAVESVAKAKRPPRRRRRKRSP